MGLPCGEAQLGRPARAPIALLILVAILVFDWAPGAGWSVASFVVSFGLGTITFVSLGLLFAGAPGPRPSALANGLFLAFLMLGGIVLPVERLPGVPPAGRALLPATAFADVLRFSLDPGLGLFRAGEYPFVVLAAWAIGATALAVRAFRWHARRSPAAPSSASARPGRSTADRGPCRSRRAAR